jgi:FAD/FMN-containing dehydrogenase
LQRPSFLLTDPRVRAAYSEGAGIYRYLPRAVARPESVDDVLRLVDWAGETGAPLIPRGAGSGMPGHNVGPHVVADLTSLPVEIAVEPSRRRLRASASATCAHLNEAARSYGLRLPPDPSSGPFATTGGMISTNAAGPRTVRYGSVRPWIEAIQVAGADGRARWITRGDAGNHSFRLDQETRRLVESRFPRTRKNSSGYALDAFARSGDELDLFVGAEGTLGIVTAAEWRLDPIPPDRAGLALGFPDLDVLGQAVPFLVALNPSAVELMDATLIDLVRSAGADLPEGLACLLIVEFERETRAAARGTVGDAVRGIGGAARYVETAVDRKGLEHLWSIRRLASPALARLPEERRSMQVIEDGCVPLERLGEYVAGLRRAADRHGVPVAIFGHAGDGHVHVNALPDTTRDGWRDALARLYEESTGLVQALGGTPSGEHGDGRLRAGVLSRFFGADLMRVFRDLKRTYDPLSMFNPGVIIPAADWDPLAGLKVGPDAVGIPADIAARLRAMERTAGWATPKTLLAGPPAAPAAPAPPAPNP